MTIPSSAGFESGEAALLRVSIICSHLWYFKPFEFHIKNVNLFVFDKGNAEGSYLCQLPTYTRNLNLNQRCRKVKTLGMSVVIGGDNLPSLVEIGLTDLPNMGGPVAPLVPSVPASLNF